MLLSDENTSIGDRENLPKQERRVEVVVVLWLDFEFDMNDQLARVYMKYQGQYYDKGTKVKIKGPRGPVTATFVGWKYQGRGCFKADSGKYFDLYDTYDFTAANKFIEEIIEPVYPNIQPVTIQTNNREKPPSWDVEVAWIWYIVIMFILTFFQARLLGWIATTIIFFGWKNGHFNNKK
jgi:hypothetical protein